MGTGFKIGGAAAGISGSMGVKTDILQIRANRNGIDLGQEMSYGCSLSVPEMPGFSVSTTQGYYHSYFCDQYSKAPGHNENKWSCPNTEVYDGQLAVDDFTIIGIDAYCGIGFSASVSFDTDYAAEELTQIWYNWEYWG